MDRNRKADSPQRRLTWTLAVTITILVGEVIGGLLSNSLALLSDAGHVLTDAFALALSLLAIVVMRKPSDFRATYGYQRIGLLMATINGISLVVMAVLIFIEAYRRLLAPPDIDTTMMLIIATAGLGGNLVMAWILGRGQKDLNIQSAWLHILGDTISSAGVIIAGVVIALTDWRIADPIASGLVGIIIIVGGVRVIKEALWVFLELSPAGFHPGEMSQMLCQIPGVKGVHDVHVWSIGHSVPAFSAHVLVDDQKISEVDSIRTEIEHALLDLGVRHSVIQMECAECATEGLYCEIRTAETPHQH